MSLLQGRATQSKVYSVEVCYLPSIPTSIAVAKTATFALGVQAGSTLWTLAQSATLSPPYSGSSVSLFNGDMVDSTWTITASKTGSDQSYMAQVSGQITIANPTTTAVQVNTIIDQVVNGPVATVTCPQPAPFQVGFCGLRVWLNRVTCIYVDD